MEIEIEMEIEIDHARNGLPQSMTDRKGEGERKGTGRTMIE